MDLSDDEINDMLKKLYNIDKTTRQNKVNYRKNETCHSCKYKLTEYYYCKLNDFYVDEEGICDKYTKGY